ISASIDSPDVCPPDNDNCEDATPIACGNSVSGTTIGATLSGMEFPSCSGGTTADVFYTLEAEAGQEYTVTVNGADYDGVLAIYSGSCDDLTEIDCADNGFSAGVAETIVFTVEEATTITIRTYDWSANRGSFTISVSCAAIVDCPELGLNIGDACDDANADTEDDTITADCECVGTITYDCPTLTANIGDACDDGNADTEEDTITANCECVGTITYDCPTLT